MLKFNKNHVRKSRVRWAALIDRGANGCIAGGDMRVIEKFDKRIDLNGIDDHIVRNVQLVTAGGVVKSSSGEIIIIIHHAANMTKESKTIFSAGQLEHSGCKVNEKSPVITGETPHIMTTDGYCIPISIKRGLPYIKMRPFRDEDWEKLPHVALTSPMEWDPSCLDSTVEDGWYEAQRQGFENYHNEEDEEIINELPQLIVRDDTSESESEDDFDLEEEMKNKKSLISFLQDWDRLHGE